MAKAQTSQAQGATQTEDSELQPALMSMMQEEVVKAKGNKLPIIRAFEAVAQKTGLKPTTIRNYYYRYLHTQDRKSPSEAGMAKDGIQDSGDIGRPFTEAETKELMRVMLTAQAKGESVRGCASRLSGGDKRVLIRLQNKYRSIIAREPEYVMSILEELKSESAACYNPYIRQPERRSTRGAWDSEMAKMDELVALMSQFSSNMKSIGGTLLQDFVKSLRDISALALKGAKRGPGPDKILAEKEREIRELQGRMAVLEAKLQKERMEADRERSMLHNLLKTNHSFVSMPDADKLSGLEGYVQRLQSVLEN